MSTDGKKISGSQEKLFSPLTLSNIYCQLLDEIEKLLKHQHFVKIHFFGTLPYQEHLENEFSDP